MSDLLLTLGHNASAVAVSVGEDGMATVDNAYELERLTGAKGDSRFPLDAIVALRERGDARFERVYVTHWDPMNRVDGLKSKYWDRSVFPQNVPIHTQESMGMTHHDCHMRAAVAFAGPDFPYRGAAVLVIDGFGNFAEHLSYYRFDERNQPVLVKRLFGYRTSLGLMYQYATAFLGLKMHEDEYKLLGYAAHAGEVGVSQSDMQKVAVDITKTLLKTMRSMDSRWLDPELDGLPEVQEAWAKRLLAALASCGMAGHPTNSFESRCVVAWIVQNVLELTVENLFTNELRRPTNLIMTGGVALNVELNRRLLSIVPGKLCVMPLAGDQGNALGLWSRHNRAARLDFGDLCWGRRRLDGVDVLPDGMTIFDRDGDEAYALLRGSLEQTGFVNLVRGRTEFGPRALCNTTTLARANDPAIVDEINRINGRDTVMPFAPVVRANLAPVLFPDVRRLHRSGEFMICALKYALGEGERNVGAALRTYLGKYTGRPQSYVAKYGDDSVARLLDDFGLLINTSFNVHGVPICCDLKDVVHSHQYQRERNPNVRTVVIREQT